MLFWICASNCAVWDVQSGAPLSFQFTLSAMICLILGCYDPPQKARAIEVLFNRSLGLD